MRQFSLTASSLRFWKRALVVCVVGLSMAAVVFYAVERFRERTAWNDYIVEARHRNVRLEPADFPFTAVPDEQNFAEIPFFQAIRVLGKSERFGRPNELCGPIFGSLLADNVLHQRLKGWSVPVETLPISVNATNGTVSSTLPEASVAKTILAQLEAETGNLWRQFQEASARPQGQFPGSFVERLRSQENHSGRPYLRIRMAQQLAMERLYLHAADGDGAAGLEDVQISLRVADMLKGDPGLTSAMIRVSVVSLLCNGIWGGLSHDIWDDPALLQIESLLANIDLLGTLRLGLESLRAEQNADCNQFLLGDFSSLGNQPESKPSRGWRFYPAGWIYRTKRMNNRHFDEVLAGMDMSRNTAKNRADDPNEFVRPGNPIQNLRNLLWMRIDSNFPLRSQSRGVFGESEVRQARTACALERFRHAHGSYPEQLSGLVSAGFIPSLPLDPVSNAPMEYERMKDGRYSLQSTEADRVARDVVDRDFPHAWRLGPITEALNHRAPAASPPTLSFR